MIERTQHDSDRRRYSLRLTAAGIDELERLRPLVVQANEELVKALSAAELASLRSLLQRLVER